MELYNILLVVHSWARWLVVFTAFWFLFQHISGLMAQRAYSKADNLSASAFLGLVHLQVVLGLALYFISPLVAVGRADMALAMKSGPMRYWVVEHILLMLIAAVVVQVGRIRAKKATTGQQRFKRTLYAYSIGIALIMLAIFTLYFQYEPNRPFFRF